MTAAIRAPKMDTCEEHFRSLRSPLRARADVVC
jgi:hypothetical protein